MIDADGVAEACEVYADNWPALEVFLACDTQWDWLSGAAAAVRVGIRLPAVESAMRLLGIPRRDRAQMLRDIKAMEAAALEEFSAQERRRPRPRSRARAGR